LTVSFSRRAARACPGQARQQRQREKPVAQRSRRTATGPRPSPGRRGSTSGPRSPREEVDALLRDRQQSLTATARPICRRSSCTSRISTLGMTLPSRTAKTRGPPPPPNRMILGEQVPHESAALPRVRPIDRLKVEEVPSPRPGPNEVVVEVKAISLNFPDALLVQGLYQVKRRSPSRRGWSWPGRHSGRRGRAQPGAGDRVIASRPGRIRPGVPRPAERVAPLPPGWTTRRASAFMLTYCTSLHALQDCGHLSRARRWSCLARRRGVGKPRPSRSPRRWGAGRRGGRPAREKLASAGSSAPTRPSTTRTGRSAPANPLDLTGRDGRGRRLRSRRRRAHRGGPPRDGLAAGGCWSSDLPRASSRSKLNLRSSRSGPYGV